MKAGPHKIGVAFVARTFAENDDTLEPMGGFGLPRVPGVFGVEIVGPTQADRAQRDAEPQARSSCAVPPTRRKSCRARKQIVSTLARKAYRRPVTDADLAAPMRFYAGGPAENGFDAGIQQAVMAILASPKFLYRVEARAARTPRPARSIRISDLELASRLSFFLWSQGPDEELLQPSRRAGKLREPGVHRRSRCGAC